MTKKEILRTIQLRQSTIKDYLNCPLMFRFKHLDKIPPEHRNPGALHGSTIHKMIYMLHRSNWNIEVVNCYCEIFEYYEFGESGEYNIPVTWKDREKELSALENNAAEILNGYIKKKENREEKVLYAEQQFRIKINGFIFTGTIDQVRKNTDGTTELIDFKSGKQRPNDQAIHNDWQLALYLYAIKYGELNVADEWIKPKLHPDYCSIYFLRAHEIRKKTTANGKAGEEKDEPLIRTTKTVQDLKIFKNQLNNLLKSMLKDWHYPNPNHCNICNYKSHCLNKSKDLPVNLVTQARKRLCEVRVAV